MSSHPTNVGRTPIDIVLRAHVEHIPVGVGHLGEVAASGVHDALGLGRSARRVQQVQQLFSVHRLSRTVGRGISHQLMPPQVPTVDHGNVCVAPVHHYNVFHGRGAGVEGGIDVYLQRRGLTTAVTGIGGDDQTSLGVLTAVHDGVRGEPSENDAVGHPDAGTGQHGHRQLWDHRHVDSNPVAPLEPQSLEHVGEPADLVE